MNPPLAAADAEAHARVVGAARTLTRARSLVDRVAAADLVRQLVHDTGYRAVLAGAPDAPTGLRAVDRLVAIIESMPGGLADVLDTLRARLAAAERDEEGTRGPSDEDRVTISTMHGAKGLEWPMVIVVGIDEPVIQSVRGDAPRLTDVGGLVLPTEVIAADGDTAPPPSAVWALAARDAAARDYAEAKRIFYVACTRARDHLVLAGAITDRGRGGVPVRPRTLASTPQWLHRDSVDRWLRHLLPGLTAGAGSIELPSPTAPLKLLVRHCPTPGAPSAADSADVATDPTAAAPSTAAAWPVLVPAADGTAPTPVAMPYVGSVAGESLLKRVWTASELLKYETCPWMHYWAYRQSLSSTDIEPSITDPGRPLSPTDRGSILHEYFQRHDPSWSAPERASALRTVLLRHRAVPDDVADLLVERLEPHVTGYERSGVSAAIRGAATVHHELPFLVALTPDIWLEGIIDLAWESAGRWHLADFKSAEFFGTPDEVSRRLDDQAREYEIQAAVYALALADQLGESAVVDFTFVFTHAGVERTLAVTPEWLGRWRARIIEIVGLIRRGVPTPGPDTPPNWAPSPCGGCAFADVCLPPGRPLAPRGSTERTLPVLPAP